MFTSTGIVQSHRGGGGLELFLMPAINNQMLDMANLDVAESTFGSWMRTLCPWLLSEQEELMRRDLDVMGQRVRERSWVLAEIWSEEVINVIKRLS